MRGRFYGLVECLMYQAPNAAARVASAANRPLPNARAAKKRLDGHGAFQCGHFLRSILALAEIRGGTRGNFEREVQGKTDSCRRLVTPISQSCSRKRTSPAVAGMSALPTAKSECLRLGQRTTSKVRVFVWDPIRAEHQGQRPDLPHQQAGHVTAPTNAAEASESAGRCDTAYRDSCPHPGAGRPGAEADQCCGLVRKES